MPPAIQILSSSTVHAIISRGLLASGRVRHWAAGCGLCEARCPVHPRRLAAPEDGRRPFPAGPEAEAFVRSWPGRFAYRPSPDQAPALAAALGDGDLPLNRVSAREDDAAAPDFLCPLCGEHRPAAARSRATLLPHAGGQPQPVCRRCHGIYRRDALFREQVVSRLGSLS